MSRSIQYIASAKDVEHWDSDVKSEFGRALSHYLAVAIQATSADEALTAGLKAFRVECLAEVVRQVTDVVNSKSKSINLTNDILRDAELMSLIDTCIQCAFQQAQSSSKAERTG